MDERVEKHRFRDVINERCKKEEQREHLHGRKGNLFVELSDGATLLIGRKGEGREVSTAAQKQPDSCTDGDNEYVTRTSEL